MFYISTQYRNTAFQILKGLTNACTPYLRVYSQFDLLRSEPTPMCDVVIVEMANLNPHSWAHEAGKLVSEHSDSKVVFVLSNPDPEHNMKAAAEQQFCVANDYPYTLPPGTLEGLLSELGVTLQDIRVGKNHFGSLPGVTLTAGNLSVNSARMNEFIVGGRVIQSTQTKLLHLLTLLMINYGDIVSHQDVVSEVWHGKGTSSGNVRNAVFRLKRLLGEHLVEGEQLIEVVPRVGIRWNLAFPVIRTPNE